MWWVRLGIESWSYKIIRPYKTIPKKLPKTGFSMYINIKKKKKLSSGNITFLAFSRTTCQCVVKSAREAYLSLYLSTDYMKQALNMNSRLSQYIIENTSELVQPLWRLECTNAQTKYCCFRRIGSIRSWDSASQRFYFI